MACDDHEFIRLTPLSIALLSYLQHHCCILQLHFFVIFTDLYQPLPYNVWLKQAGFNRSILCRRKKKWLSNAPFFCVSMHTGWSRKPGLTEKLISVLNKVSGFVKPIKRAWQCWTSFTTTSFTRMHINMYHQPPQNRSNFFMYSTLYWVRNLVTSRTLKLVSPSLSVRLWYHIDLSQPIKKTIRLHDK